MRSVISFIYYDLIYFG